jgi:hypothetical protein
MKRYVSWLVLAALLFTASIMAAAKENAPAKYNVVEVKHLTKADGIDVPTEYLNGAYDRLREDLAKSGIFGTVDEDGGAVSDPGAVVLECKIINFHNTKVAVGRVQFDVTLLSRGDHKLIQQFTTKELPINGGNWSNKARATGANLANEIKHNLK